MENNTFTYQYSAQRNKEVENIRKKYLPREVSKIEALRSLDQRVHMAGQIQALTLGIIGSLIFGIGICFGLDVLAGADWLTLLFCIVGVITMIPAYPVYRYISRKTRAELTPEILRLSDEIIRSENN
ncbi:MAG: AtpZ/AtpI family protein [Clostridia bacterium]|nr:AtpZ/AtpI family protein [Clostridia bacterium]